MNRRINELSYEERLEKLVIKNSKYNLNQIGQWLVSNPVMTMWDRDTNTLPFGARIWRRRARKFAVENIRPISAQADLHPHDYDPTPLLKAAAKKGMKSMVLFSPFGRASITGYLKNAVLQNALVAEELATESGGLALSIMLNYLGFASLYVSGSIRVWLRHMAPIILKTTYLGSPDVIAFVITEPGTGSDSEYSKGAAAAKHVVTAKSVKGGYLINGQKCFISNGAIANKFSVYAKLEGEGTESWTCFLVEKSMKGFSVGKQERKMGQRASDASEIFFDNVFVPKKNVIGKLRSGWANCQNVLNYSRPIVGAMALGHGRGAFERCLDFCKRTRLGPKRLIDYQDIQLELADMMISLWSARSMIWHSCDQLLCYESISASAKVFASDTAVKVGNQAMEIMGDHGYIHSNGVERLWRDSRLTQIYEGTNQINRLSVIEDLWDAEINNGVTEYRG